MKKNILAFITIGCCILSPRVSAASMGSAFTYQGHLNDGGTPATGLYDFNFRLHTGPGNADPQVGSAISLNAVDVSNGLFTVKLDFTANGVSSFQGDARWLNIQVKTNSNLASYSELAPRQELTPAPYALYTPMAGVADVANGVSSSTIIQGQALQVGISNSLAGAYATITGGASNTASGSFVTVAGGFRNIAISNSAAIVGGSGNIALGDHAVVVGGEMNSAIGDHAFVGGGAFNSASGYDVVSGGFSNRVSADVSGIGSGIGNRVSGYGSWIGGGLDNQVSAHFSDIGGGQLNVISTNTYYSDIGGGNQNRIGTNSHYSAIGGGQTNKITVNSFGATIAGGRGNIIDTNSSYSAIGGGEVNRIESYVEHATIPGGRGAAARSHGQLAYASGTFGPSEYSGDAQTSLYVLRGTTTNSSKTELFLDGNGSLSRSNRMIIATNGVWSFDILVAANDGTGAGAAGYQIKGVIQNNLGFTSLRSDITTVLFEDYPAWNVVVEHDLPHQALTLKVIGGASQTVRWVASVRTVELIF